MYCNGTNSAYPKSGARNELWFSTNSYTHSTLCLHMDMHYLRHWDQALCHFTSLDTTAFFCCNLAYLAGEIAPSLQLLDSTFSVEGMGHRTHTWNTWRRVFVTAVMADPFELKNRSALPEWSSSQLGRLLAKHVVAFCGFGPWKEGDGETNHLVHETPYKVLFHMGHLFLCIVSGQNIQNFCDITS